MLFTKLIQYLIDNNIFAKELKKYLTNCNFFGKFIVYVEKGKIIRCNIEESIVPNSQDGSNSVNT